MNQIKDVQVYDIEKRYVPSKHYAYCIMVTEKNNAKHIIYRRYSEFFKLHSQLLDRFKEEAGAKDPLKRILPNLPPKKLLGRSHVKSVALARLYPLDIYCKKLISLKKEISDSDLVKSFFSINDNDILQSINEHNLDKKVQKYEVPKEISTPMKGEEFMTICDFEAQGLTELSVKKNTKVTVLEKDMSGWWLVETQDGFGYIPSSILNVMEQKPIILENPVLNIVIRDFEATRPDEISIKKAEYVHVIEKNFNGYWKVKINHRTGYVPANHLQLPNEPHKTKMEDHDSFDESDEEYMPNVNKSTQRNEFRLAHESSNIPKHFNESNPSNIYLPTNNHSLQPSALSNYTSMDKYIVVEDYLSPDNETISLRKNQIVQVLDSQSSSEWWFIQLDDLREGWAPSSFLRKYDSSYVQTASVLDFSSRIQKLNLDSNENSATKTNQFSFKGLEKPNSKININSSHSNANSLIKQDQNNSYVVKEDYLSPDDNSISLSKGQIVQVLNKDNPDGWWHVRRNNQEGWAPSSYLYKIDVPQNKPMILTKKPNILPKPNLSNNYHNTSFAPNLTSYSQQMTVKHQDSETSKHSVKELRAKLEQNFSKR